LSEAKSGLIQEAFLKTGDYFSNQHANFKLIVEPDFEPRLPVGITSWGIASGCFGSRFGALNRNFKAAEGAMLCQPRAKPWE
jgi:hypothetical protein